MIGQTVRHYPIMDKIGEAGIVTAYLAEGTGLTRGHDSFPFSAIRRVPLKGHDPSLLRCGWIKLSEGENSISLLEPSRDSRGAADTSGDGKVTLNEAYQFAFHETLGRTTETQAGTQHPSYDISLSGTGDVVMPDSRVTSALLVLNEELSGGFFVRNRDEQLEVELYKLRGRSVELGLEPGTYEVLCDSDSGSSVSVATLLENDRFVLAPHQFIPTKQEPVLVRGGEGIDPRLGGLKGRFGLGGVLGFWNSGGMGSSDSDFEFAKENTTAGVTVSYWLREKWSVNVNAWTTMSLVQGEQLPPNDAYISALLFGGKRYFPNLGGIRPSIKPFVAAAGGPYFRDASSRAASRRVCGRLATSAQ